MPRTPPTSARSRSAGWRVILAAAMFIGSAAGVAFLVVGDESEPIEARYADHLWKPWPFVAAHETAIEGVSLVVFIVTGVLLVRDLRAGRLRLRLLAQVIVLALFAAWLGLGYRVVTAGVVGANIGGGGVLLLTPLLAFLTVGIVAGLGIASRVRRTGEVIPPTNGGPQRSSRPAPRGAEGRGARDPLGPDGHRGRRR